MMVRMTIVDSTQEPELVSVQPRGAKRRRPLLFVHGVYHGGWCFLENFIPYFAAQGHPCHALTLRGHRLHDAGTIRFSRSEYLADLRRVVASISPAPLVIGHSFGGMLAQFLLAEGTLRDAVLLATPTPGALLRRAVAETLHHPRIFLPAWLRLDLQRAYHSEVVSRDSFFSPDLPRASFERYVSRLRAISYGTWSFLRMLLAPIPRPRNPLAARVLVVGGRNDPTCTPAVEHAIARLYDTLAVIVDGVSHDLMLDARWQDAADVVSSWITTLPAGQR
jgi:pimeloyl-ACP methyl ester carboxylesterase